MYILIRRSYLNGHGLTVIGKLRRRLIEPVFRLGGRSLVIKREQDEVALNGITLTDSLQCMLATLQLRVEN